MPSLWTRTASPRHSRSSCAAFWKSPRRSSRDNSTRYHAESLPDPASYADLVFADAQSLMINQVLATYAAQYPYRLVVSGT